MASDFESNHPMSMGYVITGVRGCGKTVLMTSIQNDFVKRSLSDNGTLLRKMLGVVKKKTSVY